MLFEKPRNLDVPRNPMGLSATDMKYLGSWDKILKLAVDYAILNFNTEEESAVSYNSNHSHYKRENTNHLKRW